MFLIKFSPLVAFRDPLDSKRVFITFKTGTREDVECWAAQKADHLMYYEYEICEEGVLLELPNED